MNTICRHCGKVLHYGNPINSGIAYGECNDLCLPSGHTQEQHEFMILAKQFIKDNQELLKRMAGC
jgi:hypothetical protein